MSIRDPRNALRVRLLREVLVLFTLFVVPGLVGNGASSPVFGFGVLAVIAIRNAAFSLLVLYILDLQDERGLVSIRPARRPPGSRIATAGIVVAGMFGAALVVSTLTSGSPQLSAPVRFAVPAGGVAAWTFRILLLLAMLAVGLAEELFFRAYLLARFAQLGARRASAIVVSSLLFGLGHTYQGITGVVFATLAGVALGALWTRRADLGAFAVGHATYNVAAILISGGL